jgi:hypothetical protein
MIIEVDFDFLVKHKMSIEQYMLCYILHMDKQSIKNGERQERKSGSPVAIIYKYTENVAPISPRGMKDLIDRGYLEKTGSKLVPDMLEVTNKFKQEVFNHWTNFQQLFDIYPDRISFGPGKHSASLKSLDRPQEEVAESYTKVVRTNKKHKEVLKIVQWAKEKNLIRKGIQKFIYSRDWDILKEKYEVDFTDDTTDSYEVFI